MVDPTAVSWHIGTNMFRYIKAVNLENEDPRSFHADGVDPVLIRLRHAEPSLQFKIVKEVPEPLKKKITYQVEGRIATKNLVGTPGQLKRNQYKIEVVWGYDEAKGWKVLSERALESF